MRSFFTAMICVYSSLLMAGNVLDIVFNNGNSVAKSPEFRYETGKIRVQIPSKPAWVDFVEFCAGMSERKIDIGASSMSWSSSAPQQCLFKVKINYDKIQNAQPWIFSVKSEDGNELYEVRVNPPCGTTKDKRPDAGIVESSAEGDVRFSFSKDGGTLKSPPKNYVQGKWKIDTTQQPDWVKRIKISSLVIGEQTLMGGNRSGGRNINSFSVNGTMEFSFVVTVDVNKSGNSRKWLLPVHDESGKALFTIVIVQI